MKIVTVIGARPQFIKAATVSRAFLNDNSINEIIVHTGQHFDANMSTIFFEELDIPVPHYHLNINGGSHGAMTGKMLEQIEEVLIKERPDFVLVYGDTNSTLAGALAAKKVHCKVIHVEAGLRSFNNQMPEEINRIVTDRIADVLFCPTEQAIANLMKEGFNNLPVNIINCGDVMLDAAHYYAAKSERSNIVTNLGLNNFILCTIHRAENTNNIYRLTEIIEALNIIAKKINVVLPLHPRTKQVMESAGIKIEFDVIAPVGYLDMIQLIKRSALIMTDSGGLQKEAFFFKKHCVTLRDETEWVELVEQGFNVLVGANQSAIIKGVEQMLTTKSNFDVDLYGNGNASGIIVNTIKQIVLSTSA